MDILVMVYPNAGENWVTSPPISGYPLVEGQQGYCFSVAPYTIISRVCVPGALLDVSSIESSVELVESLDFTDKENSISGVGGIATEMEVTVTINNLEGLIDVYSLLGRSLEIYRTTPSSTEFNESTIRFRGYINNIEPSKNGDI